MQNQSIWRAWNSIKTNLDRILSLNLESRFDSDQDSRCRWFLEFILETSSSKHTFLIYLYDDAFIFTEIWTELWKMPYLQCWEIL